MQLECERGLGRRVFWQWQQVPAQDRCIVIYRYINSEVRLPGDGRGQSLPFQRLRLQQDHPFAAQNWPRDPTAPVGFCCKEGLCTASVYETMNESLKLISGEQVLVLEPTDGQETLGQATDIFRYIDHNFERWNCNIVGPPTKETAVQVYEMIRNSTFQELFGGLDAKLDSLALTQAQIKQFAKHYRDWLQVGGNGTFFLFKIGNEFFVAAAYFFSDGQIGMRLRRLTLERVFRAQKRHRLVVKSF
jgi:hypothetical protein